MSDHEAQMQGRQSSARLFVEAAEAALCDLERRLPLGMGPLERSLGARVREAAAQLLACAGELERDELMISGSTGQRRTHPLLKTLAELRREVSDGLKELTFRAEQRQMYERLRQGNRPGRGEGPRQRDCGEGAGAAAGSRAAAASAGRSGAAARPVGVRGPEGRHRRAR